MSVSACEEHEGVLSNGTEKGMCWVQMGEASPDLMGAEISVRASVGGVERRPMRVSG